MPRQGIDTAEKLRPYVEEFGPDVFSTNGESLMCDVCRKSVKATEKYFLQQHVRGSRHLARLNSRNLSPRENPFNMDVGRMLVESNIPPYKLQHPSFRGFMEKYCGKVLPDHTTLRKTYLKKVYDETLLKIRASVGEHRIWVSIDETTDVKGRFVVNTVVGCLSAQHQSRAFLTEFVERTNHSTVAQALVNSLNLLWPEGLRNDKVLLLVTYAAAYMKKAGDALKVLFPKMTHVTCVIHAMHRVCEEIRVLFPAVDNLIANVKKNFLKAPFRVQNFRLLMNIGLPPQPVLTRWGTWLAAALYYAENFEAVRSVVSMLEGAEAASIRRSQEIMDDSTLSSDLAFIGSNFAQFPNFMTKLECSSLPLSSSLNILEEFRVCLPVACKSMVPPGATIEFAAPSNSCLRSSGGQANTSALEVFKNRV
ncbi:uncharacterized protein LOC114828252 [Galendromus occidentalis]|uniref:Uncharacterized protein LOC114828252 n=1 Tax=Galendromus occidentalis TaxID=34638 RepID=A0AAJ7SG42_9ACAR|nr:uncharacterized protein LOC114828252 [Galendromus occidentalis]